MNRFLGIWSKNNAEWMVSILAAMKVKTSAVGFYDAMGNSAVDYIVKQTELKTIICTKDYMEKMIVMKKEGLCECVRTLICMNGTTA